MEKKLLNQLADRAKESTVNYTVGTCSNSTLLELNVEMIDEFLKNLEPPIAAITHILRWEATDKAANVLDQQTRTAINDLLELAILVYANQYLISLLDYWFEDLHSELKKARTTK